MALPNTFILGIQKAGTSSLHYWLSQHPDIYGPSEIKDKNLIINQDKNFDAEKELKIAYSKNGGEPVLLYSYVNSIFYPDALEKIASLSPSAKLIISLRDPVKRCFSAYKYFQKRNRETRDIEEALSYSPKFPLPFSDDNSDFTYIEHGLYSLQIEYCLKYFNRKQILILDFDELKNAPKNVLLKIYQFLHISDDFYPNLDSKNVTGNVRFKRMQKMLFESNPLRKWIVTNIVNNWLPAKKRRSIKKSLVKMNTKKNKGRAEVREDKEFSKIVPRLKRIYLQDIIRLDEMLDTDYVTKWRLNS